MEIKTSNESMVTLMLALHKLIGSAKLEHILQNSMGNTLTGLNVIALKIFYTWKGINKALWVEVAI